MSKGWNSKISYTQQENNWLKQDFYSDILLKHFYILSSFLLLDHHMFWFLQVRHVPGSTYFVDPGPTYPPQT